MYDAETHDGLIYSPGSIRGRMSGYMMVAAWRDWRPEGSVRECSAECSFENPPAQAHLGDVLGIVEGGGSARHEKIIETEYAFNLPEFNALVVVHPSEPVVGWGDDTAIEYALDGTYRPLVADGTLGDPVETVRLPLGETAILIPAL